MSIFRVEKTKDYTVICNKALNDKRLSWQAKGLWAYLMSRPDDWKIYLKQLMTASTNGKTSTTSAIKELEEFGYITKNQIKMADGTFNGYDYKVFEDPKTQEKPESENQKTDNGKAEKRTLLNTDVNQVCNELNTDTTKGMVASEKPKPLHEQFVDEWKKRYEEVTGEPYNDDTKAYVLANNLIRKFGTARCCRKAGILANACKNPYIKDTNEKKFWFVKGWADFTVENLSNKWNQILPLDKSESIADEQWLEKLKRAGVQVV